MRQQKVQRTTFEMVPTTNPDETIGHARYVINTSSGIGMDVLKRIIEEHIPIVNNDKVMTVKKIIYTGRYECPCCNTDLTALVRVGCQGLMTDEWDKVQGLYRVSICPDHGGCKVTVEKLSGTTIYQGRSSYLPRKDYNADFKASKEIEDRYAMIAKMAQKNPGKVLLVDGIETGEDLSNLVDVAIKKFFD